jgi:hypothetical protein
MVATPSFTETEFIGVTSITIPSLEDRPAQECPPLRVAVGSPERTASLSVSATSSALAHRTTACGRTPWKRASKGFRTAS